MPVGKRPNRTAFGSTDGGSGRIMSGSGRIVSVQNATNVVLGVPELAPQGPSPRKTNARILRWHVACAKGTEQPGMKSTAWESGSHGRKRQDVGVSCNAKRKVGHRCRAPLFGRLAMDTPHKYSASFAHILASQQSRFHGDRSSMLMGMRRRRSFIAARMRDHRPLTRDR